MKENKLSKEELELYLNFKPTTICDYQNYLRLISDAYFEMVSQTQMLQQELEGIQNYFAKMTMQMFFTKALATINLLDGVGYVGRTCTLPPIHDHSLLFIIARNFCETVAAYEVLFLLPDTNEKRVILENLFICSGNRYQLRLFSESMHTKYSNEYSIVNKNIKVTKAQIKNTSYYKSLSLEQQENIKSAIRTKNYKLLLLDDEVKIMSWQECLNHFVSENDIMDRIYTYFSLHTHPSIRGMEQFDAAYEMVNPESTNLSIVACQSIISFMSMFLQEYIKLFPKAKEVFDQKSDFEKRLLTMYDYRKNK